MFMNSFSSFKAREIVKFDYLKTVANRRFMKFKTELDKVKLKADEAFWTAKSHILKNVHWLVKWKQKLTAEKQQAENHAIAELKVKRNHKKRAAEIKFLMMHERGKLNELSEFMNKVNHAGETESMKDMNFAELSMSSVSENMMLNDDKEKELNDEWLTENENIAAELQKIKKTSSDKF